jgi:PAS domain S-box-containing protein
MTNGRRNDDGPALFAGGGEMGERIRAFDWSTTAIGPIETWSPALRMQVGFLLANRFPILLWWGPTFCSIYNDAYAPILGSKHPWALGQPVREVWSEIWDVLRPLIETPFGGGPPTWIEDFQLEIRRHGYLEEGHFTVAYSPVPDETAPRGIGGVVATVHEISGTVIGERRIAALRDLGSRASEGKTAGEACAIAAATLAAYGKDLPFVLLYLIDAEAGTATLAGAAGVPTGEEISPRTMLLGEARGAAWPFSEARRDDALLVVERLTERFPAVPRSPWSDPPHTAAVLPIPSHARHEPAGLLVAGVSPRLKLDERYRDFLELLRTQLATAIANARAYEEERKRAEALAEIDRAKTAFFSNVSHEFRTPLALMLGPVEDLLARSQTDLSPAATSLLEVVNRNGLRLLRLVNTLLDFSRIEAGRVRAVFQPTDLAAFTAELASVFRAAVERAGLRLRVDCPPLGEPVYVDRDMWEKIVLNLLSNAFKFTFEGEIAVSLGVSGDTAQLRVRDTGTGIPAHEMPRLFERFHRIQDARGRTHEGSGIGLALVQELVKQHGGTITAESLAGQGSTFIIAIPLGSHHLPADQIGDASPGRVNGAGATPFVEEALQWLPDEPNDQGDLTSALPMRPEAIPVPALQREAPDDDRPRILLADDNADMRRYLERLLAERYAVEAVADGEAALAAARRRAPDLVLTDVMMPRLDGLGLLRELRAGADTREAPVILLSARAGEESRVEGMEAGADDYLIKPFSARELLARVAAHLQMARMRREAAEAIRHRGEQFKTLLDQAPLGVYLVDADLRIREVNPIALPVFGDIPGGVVGRDLDEVLHILWAKPYADEIVGIFRRTLRTGEPFIAPEQAEFRIDRGVTEYYEWRVDRILLPEGRQGVVCYFRDISAQVMARQAIEESREALRAADRRKDEFLAMLAHELRGPLAPLSNLVEVMKGAAGDPARLQQARDGMERQLNQLVRLVDDLLDLSRITSNRLELRRERVELEAVIRQAVENCRPLAAALRHQVTVAPPDESFELDADPVRLAQVFGNLINNALKYTPPGGHVWVTAARQRSQVIVQVRDSGIGIPHGELARIFGMFTQVDGSLERSQGGLGIGLTLVKLLVEMHDGTVEAFSDGPGQGSAFVVRLPLPGEAAPAPPPVVPLGPEPQAPARRILVVDDNEDSASSLADLLAIQGHETRTAHDGLEAVAAAEAFRPEVVLLDIGLPRLNGYDAARQIREQPWGKAMLLVALTGWGQDEDRRKSIEAGFDAHLVKPANPDALRKLLASRPRRE